MFVLFLFQNCADFEGLNYESIKLPSVAEEGDCESIKMETFVNHIYPFFTKNSCVSCHSENTSQPFASDQIQLAFHTYDKLGLDRIDQILSAGHKGNDYSGLEVQLKKIEEEIVKSDEKIKVCKENSDDDSELELVDVERITSAKKLNIFSNKKSKLCRLDYHLEKDVDDPLSIEWDLEKDFGEDFKGVRVSVDIILETYEFTCTDKELCKDNFYCVNKFYVNNPRLTTGQSPILIKNLNILAGDKDFSLTTFSHIDTVVEINKEKAELVPGGSAGLIEANGDVLFSNETTWKIKFERLLKTDTL